MEHVRSNFAPDATFVIHGHPDLAGSHMGHDAIIAGLDNLFQRVPVHDFTLQEMWVTIGADDGLDELVRTMAQHEVKRLPVIDGHRLIGVVSEADLAEHGETAYSPGDALLGTSAGHAPVGSGGTMSTTPDSGAPAQRPLG